MNRERIEKYLLTFLVIGCSLAFVYLALETKTSNQRPWSGPVEYSSKIDEAMDLLRTRRNKDALAILDKILLSEPKNPDAIWGKAEVFRRAKQYKLAELMFKEVLDIDPGHLPALISLAYLRYTEGNLRAALNITNQAFILSGSCRQGRALTYVLLGLINSARPFNGGVIARINRSLEIKSYFLKAARLAPELPETHLSMGVFYLEAPFLEGGNLKQAIRELKRAVEIAPEFSEANALLAQAYKKQENIAARDSQLYRDKRLMMGTFVEVISPDIKAGKIVFEEFRRIENLLSRYNTQSEIYQLNRSGYLKVSPETFFVIKKSKELWLASKGAFDITTGPLVDLWGFGKGQNRVPGKEEITKTLELIGSDKIILQDIDSVVQLKIPGMKLDLGGVAKGYALDCAAKKLREAGIKSCLINAGGQVYCLGGRPAQPWRIAIKAAQGNVIA
nr:FAD:protein FMN transferase [Candidatus Omnitrophota bacterium]